MRVALVHDFLREYGGGERVLEALHQLFPQAPVYTAFIDKKALGLHWSRFADWDLRSTWFAKIPGHKKLYSPLRFLAPKAFASLDLSTYDVVISSTNAFQAKAVNVSQGKHLCYCHTPPRSLYGYSTMGSWKKGALIRLGGTLINHYMRVVDFYSSRKPNVMIANSEETQRRIKKFYQRDSVLIYPPVQLALSTNQLVKLKNNKSSEYYLYVNRLGLQKHPELALRACLELKRKLIVVGTGPMEAELIKMASDSSLIKFVGAVDDQQLAKLYAQAKALLYPVEDEDFGMVPVEAMMAGTPVIAHRSGGPMDTIKPGINGLFFDDLTKDSLIKAMKKFETLSFDSSWVRASTKPYTMAVFHKQIRLLVNKVLIDQVPVKK